MPSKILWTEQTIISPTTDTDTDTYIMYYIKLITINNKD